MSVGFSSGEGEVDLEGLRRRLQKMKDQELRQFETAAKFMCSPGANNGQPPRQALVAQLDEARAELERRKTAEPPCRDKQSMGLRRKRTPWRHIESVTHSKNRLR